MSPADPATDPLALQSQQPLAPAGETAKPFAPDSSDLTQPAGRPQAPASQPVMSAAELTSETTWQRFARTRPAGESFEPFEGRPQFAQSGATYGGADVPFRPFDFGKILDIGLRRTLPGSAKQYFQLRSEIESVYGALKADPTYDPFADKQIIEAGMSGNMALFAQSRSANETRLILRYAAMRSQDERAIAQMTGPARAAADIATIALDPTTYVGGSGAGVRVTQRLAWGYLSSSAKAAVVTAASQAPVIFGQRYVDPTFFLSGVLEPLALPAAIGAGIGILRHADRVRSVRMGIDPDLNTSSGLLRHIAALPKEGGEAAERFTIRAPSRGDRDWSVIHHDPDGGQRFIAGYRNRAEALEAAQRGEDWLRTRRLMDEQRPPPLPERPHDAPEPPRAPAAGSGKRAAAGAKLTDAAGQPRTFYHGTRAATAELKAERSLYGGTWFAVDPAYADVYASGVSGAASGGHIFPVHLAVKNPITIPGFSIGRRSLFERTIGRVRQAVQGELPYPQSAHERFAPGATRWKDPAETTAEVKRLKEQGYDAVYDPEEGGGAWLVFDDEAVISKPHYQAASTLDRAPPVGDEAVPARSVLDSAPPVGDEADGVPRSLSAAAVAPNTAPSALAGLLDREAVAETGVGLEKLRWTPWLRLKASSSLYARQLVDYLVDASGLLTKKNQTGVLAGLGPEASRIPVETKIAQHHTPLLVEALQDYERAWLEARGARARQASAPGTTGNALIAMKLWATDRIGMTEGLSATEFEVRVGRAAARSDRDPVQDHYSPFVERAAQSWRKLADYEKQLGIETGLFESAYSKRVDQLKRELEANRKAGGGAVSSSAQARYDKAVENLEKLRLGGPSQNTAPSYLPRYWLVEELRRRADEFLAITENWLVNFKKVDPAEAKTVARQIHDRVARITARPDLSDIAATLDEAMNPASALARSFEIPDELVEDFLERNISIISKHHVRTWAPDVELMRAFDNTDLEPQIGRVRDEYTKLLEAETDPQKRLELNRQRESDIEDIKALRDKLRGTYGAEKDPHNWSSRTVRVLKNYAAWTTMGLSAYSQLGDLFRPAITEGLDAVHRYGLGSLVDDSRALIFLMAHNERVLAGDSVELVTSARSLAAADMGDIFMARSKMERQANQYTGLFYMLNGMNLATDFTKDIASIISIGRMNDALVHWADFLDGKRADDISDWEKERFFALSIDGALARRMADQIRTHGMPFKSVHLPNTAHWTDDYAVEHYRAALLRSVHRSVITPGVADKANWMSSELGSLVMQFRTFGASSAIRTLYAGLQEKEYNFWHGAALLVGAAAVMNEIRKQVFYDKSSLEQPWLGVLADAVDRSGVLGIFFDANNVLEVASQGQLGIRPMLGAGQTWNPLSRVANALGGPVAGQAFRALDVLGDVMQGDLTANTWRNMRGFVPGQNLFWADPVFDQLFPAANGKTGRLSDGKPARAPKAAPRAETFDPVAGAYNVRYPPPPEGSPEEADEKALLYGTVNPKPASRRQYLNDRHTL